MNKIILMGNLTKDPTTQQTANGKTLTRLTVAVSRKFANSDGQRETDFFNATAFGTTAEFINKYFQKGSKILIEGELRNNTVEKNGEKRYFTEILVDSVEFVTPKTTAQTNEPTAKTTTTSKEEDDDELPF